MKKNRGVIQGISANDKMFSGDRNHYFSVGASALESIDLALAAARKERHTVRKILDLPCGYGRVLRHVRAAFPWAEIAACDVERDAVDYCAATFNARAIYSETHPHRISIEGDYDLIWCGSLLTHLDEERSRGFIGLFHSLLSENGVLLFSLHGPSCAYAVRSAYVDYQLDKSGINLLLSSYDDSGYGYADYPGGRGYGISLISPTWVAKQFQDLRNLRLLTYTEMGWDNHQDVVACVLEPLEMRLKRALTEKLREQPDDEKASLI